MATEPDSSTASFRARLVAGKLRRMEAGDFSPPSVVLSPKFRDIVADLLDEIALLLEPTK